MDDQDQSNDGAVADDNQQPEGGQQTQDSADAGSPVLDSVKKEALEALMPVIDTIEGSPQRKFDILMTALRVSFQTELLQQALKAAKTIDDPSAKAEALIDVLNEVSFQEQNG